MIKLLEKMLTEWYPNGVIVATSPSGEEVKVNANDFLNVVTDAVVGAGYGHRLAKESMLDDNSLLLEFESSNAPGLEIKVKGKEIPG